MAHGSSPVWEPVMDDITQEKKKTKPKDNYTETKPQNKLTKQRQHT